jgi:uncharacterized protein YkwD
MKQARHQRLGAYGLTAVLSITGASALLRQCNPAPTPAPAAVSAPLAVSDMLGAVNGVRAQSGLPALTESWNLDMAAIDHSTDMAQRRTMSHSGYDGSNAGQRIAANGYSAGTWGENVAAGQQDVVSVMSAWMNSAGHRANILNPAFSAIGFAAVTAANGTIYWTMVLAAPR